MTAVSLFDVLARDGAGASAGLPESGEQLAHFAEQLVAAALSDLERLRDFERQFAQTRLGEPARELERDRAVWRLYTQWAAVAEQVLGRARSVAVSGIRIDGAGRLDDAIGRVRARLSLTPEQIAKAREQARQGQFVPAKGLRDELHARLRA